MTADVLQFADYRRATCANCNHKIRGVARRDRAKYCSYACAVQAQPNHAAPALKHDRGGRN